MALPTRVHRYTYAEPYESAQREFDTVLGKLFNGTPANGNRPSSYAVDVREDADHFYVEAELPGFKKENIEITLEKQQLTISAQRNDASQQEAPKGELLLNERRYNRFLRSFRLPPPSMSRR